MSCKDYVEYILHGYTLTPDIIEFSHNQTGYLVAGFSLLMNIPSVADATMYGQLEQVFQLKFIIFLVSKCKESFRGFLLIERNRGYQCSYELLHLRNSMTDACRAGSNSKKKKKQIYNDSK